jgi:hypothetical protein
MVIPPACVGLPAGVSGPATALRSPENRPHAAPRGRPTLAWAPGEDGPNLRRTTPKSPVRVASGRTRLLPADWALGVVSAPRNSHGLPESRSRESRPTTRRPREPHRRHGGWRHPPPGGSPSGPVGPSGRSSNPDFPVQPRRPLGAKRNLEGGRGRVKAMFPLARRVCPAQDGRTTSMEFPVMSRASGQARPGAQPGRTPTGSVSIRTAPYKRNRTGTNARRALRRLRGCASRAE